MKSKRRVIITVPIMPINMDGTKPINMEGTPPLRGVPYPTF